MLTVLCGLPYTGKSTYVLDHKKTGVVVISLSNIRDEMGLYDQNFNKNVAGIAQERVYKALKEGKDVIYDATNVLKCYRKAFIAIAEDLSVPTKIVFFDKPVDVLIKQNISKNFPFSNEVIINMFNNLEVPTTDEADTVVRVS